MGLCVRVCGVCVCISNIVSLPSSFHIREGGGGGGREREREKSCVYLPRTQGTVWQILPGYISCPSVAG